MDVGTTSRPQAAFLLQAVFLTAALVFFSFTPPLPALAQTEGPRQRVAEELPDGTFRYKNSAVSVALPTRDAGRTGQSCAAAAPALVSPAEDAVSNDLDAPRFTWISVLGITEYVLQLALDNTFEDPLSTESAYNSTHKSQVTRTSWVTLDPKTTYYWRVASVCADGQIGAFSSPVTFKTGSGSGGQPCTLPSPTLRQPANGTQAQTLLPYIAWQRMPNTFEYYFELATDSAFQHVIDTLTDLGIDPDLGWDIGFNPFDNLVPDTVYYWHVASI